MTENNREFVEFSNMEIINDGVDLLRQNLGDVKTEMFISLIIREKFDYTKWRRKYFGDTGVQELNEEAVRYSSNNPFTPKKELKPING